MLICVFNVWSSQWFSKCGVDPNWGAQQLQRGPQPGKFQVCSLFIFATVGKNALKEINYSLINHGSSVSPLWPFVWFYCKVQCRLMNPPCLCMYVFNISFSISLSVHLSWSNPLLHPSSQMRFLLLFSRQGKLRLQKWFTPISEREKKKIIRDMTNMVLARQPRSCNFLDWKDLKIIYKRWVLVNLPEVERPPLFQSLCVHHSAPSAPVKNFMFALSSDMQACISAWP